MTDQPGGYSPPQQQPNAAGFGAPGAPQGQPQQGFGAAPGGQAGFGAAPGGAAPSQPPVFGAPGQQQPGYGAPGQQPGYGAPGQQPGYGSPGQQPGYGSPGQQPGYGAPGQQPPAFGAPGSFTPGPEEPKKGGKGRLAGILGVGGVIVVGIIIKLVLGLGVGAAANALAEDPTKDAKAGQCLDQTPELKEGEEGKANNVSVVDCTDADATSVIVGRVDNLTSAQTREQERCFDFVAEGESFTMLYPLEADANSYYILCLKDK